MPNLFDPLLIQTLSKDKEYLEHTRIPIFTVSASYKEDLKELHGLPDNDQIPDIVFSRAHFSMALSLAAEAWGKSVQPEKAWIVDPTNYVSRDDWRSVKLTETIGKTIARYGFLQTLKSVIDKFGRQKLPILESITPPLLYLCEHISQPILSLHIAAGNILAGTGKTVIQVVTDPHIRSEYLEHAESANFLYCVFDENTRFELLEKAALMDKAMDAERIITTGPPIHPRILTAGRQKKAWRQGPLNLCITTGGLGTNKTEILSLMDQLLPELRKKTNQYRILVYAATHHDIYQDVLNMAKKHRVSVGKTEEKNASLRVMYHPQIVDANELLLTHGFSWAHGFITKPSGDMAYDAAAAGCFLLTLSEWGEWEEKIREVFEQKSISRRAQTKSIVEQLELLKSARGMSQSWIEQAMHKARQIDPLFINGSKNILKIYQEIADK
ncbi:hypothetical protein KBC79_04750 [Candidatus Woesebacteria bacterium]|nr:hypothetical protein [Candidatus Woesebacteria bacterium]